LKWRSRRSGVINNVRMWKCENVGMGGSGYGFFHRWEGNKNRSSRELTVDENTWGWMKRIVSFKRYYGNE